MLAPKSPSDHKVINYEAVNFTNMSAVYLETKMLAQFSL